jgi:uncharacterized protein (PEP-CTERM system associated)
VRRHALSAKKRGWRLARCGPCFGVIAALVPVAQALAQDAAGRTSRIVPSFTIDEEFTNNVNLSSTNPQSELITTLSPGISWIGNSGRVRGSLDYSLNWLLHARDSSRNQLQNALNANISAELVEQRIFIDASAGISQQTISPFGTQSSGTGLVNDNSTEVYTLSISPSLRTPLGGYADLTASAGWFASAASSTDLGDSATVNAAVGLSGGQGRFGWGLDAIVQGSAYNVGLDYNSDYLFGTLRFAPTSALQLSVRAGNEGREFGNGQRVSSDFWGYGVSWQPSPRTSLSWQEDQRYFGESWSFSFQHRMAKSIWSYTDSRGLNDSSGAGDPLNSSQSRAVSNYDLFFAQFASLEPDPTKRDQLVRGFLQANGIDANAAINGGFLTAGQTVQRSQNLSVGLIGQRNTVTLSAFATDTEPAATADISTGNFADVGRVRQQGYSVGVSHRLTPTSSVGLTGSLLKTLDEPSRLGNEERLLTLDWSGQIGYRTFASAGMRRTVFDSATNPYNESAIYGSIRWQF